MSNFFLNITFTSENISLKVIFSNFILYYYCFFIFLIKEKRLRVKRFFYKFLR